MPFSISALQSGPHAPCNDARALIPHAQLAPPAHLVNGALAACASAPRYCGIAVGATALTAAGLAFSLLAQTPGMQHPDTPLSAAQQDGLVAQIHQIDQGTDRHALEAELLAIARQCEGDRGCRATRINELLQHLPDTKLAQLQQWVQATAPSPASSSWPPGAHAMPLLTEGSDALVWLADILAALYTPEVAMLQSDLEAIVPPAPRQGASAEGDAAINEDRLQIVEALLQRDGLQVQRLPYTFTPTRGSDLQPGQTVSAWNLHARAGIKGGDAPPVQRLLLVAHADMIGAAEGSQGAIDNASGVVALLHVARQLQARPPAGLTIELLITSNEEIGLHGSRAYVAQCTNADTCPWLVVNVDMVGRGGHGLLLTSSTALHGRQDTGLPPYYLQVPVISDTERQAKAAMIAEFVKAGFVQHQAHPGFLLTSDNLPFANASIPTLGLSQGSAADAAALQERDNRTRAWLVASKAMNWQLLDSLRDGTTTLDEAATAALRKDYRCVSAAWKHRQQWHAQHPRAAAALIHGAGDRLHRVDPRMAVYFADALLAFIHRWSKQPAATIPLAPEGIRNA